MSDFGIATNFGPEHTAETGTYRSMAPEVITHQRYDQACDVYSFGVLLWEICHQEIPFGKESFLQAAFAVAVERKRPPIELSQPLDYFGTLIQSCWTQEAAGRPTMADVVADVEQIEVKLKQYCEANGDVCTSKGGSNAHLVCSAGSAGSAPSAPVT